MIINNILIPRQNTYDFRKFQKLFTATKNEVNLVK